MSRNCPLYTQKLTDVSEDAHGIDPIHTTALEVTVDKLVTLITSSTPSDLK